LKTKFILILLVVSASTSSCDLFSIKGHKNNTSSKSELLTKPVARAHKTFLYFKDLEGLIPANTSKSDSINLISRYVRSWINKQLVIAEASEKLNIDEADLERKLLDYQYAILIHEYQKFYIEQKLNEEVKDSEIEQYYTLNKDNFPLRQSIVKCRFVKVPNVAPRINQLPRLIQSTSSKDFRDLKTFCYQYAATFFLDSIWMNFDEIVKNTPLVNIDNKVHFIMNNRYYETSDDAFFYAFKISEYRISNEIAPLDWVKDDIKKIILNKRKVALAKELEDKIYDRAAKNHDFEIFEIH
jgi:hypothetical protein